MNYEILFKPHVGLYGVEIEPDHIESSIAFLKGMGIKRSDIAKIESSTAGLELSKQAMDRIESHLINL